MGVRFGLENGDALTLPTVWFREVVVFAISSMASTIFWPSAMTWDVRKRSGRIFKCILGIGLWVMWRQLGTWS